MISITLHGHPDKGASTRFTINSWPGDRGKVTWEREVVLSAFGFTITEGRRDVSTVEMVNEMMDHENATTDFMLRALGWSEVDLEGMWDAHRERAVRPREVGCPGCNGGVQGMPHAINCPNGEPA